MRHSVSPPFFFLLTAIAILAFSLPGHAALSNLNGIASYESLNKEQFIAALYLEAPERDPKRLLTGSYPAQMEMRITADRISPRSLVNLWVERIAINNEPGVLTSQAENLVRFNQIFKKSLRKNDRLVLVHHPKTGVEVKLNGVPMASIASSRFFHLLLSTWIGEVPLSSSFREGILGKSGVDPALQERFTSLEPSVQRQREVAGWVLPPKQESAENNVEKGGVALEPSLPPVPEKKPAPAKVVAQKPRGAEASVVVANNQAAPPLPAPTRGQEEEEEEEEVEVAEMDLESRKRDLLLRQNYYSQLVKHLYKYKTIPLQAFQRRLDGEVVVSVKIDRGGKLLSSEIVKTSRHSIFNEQAILATRRADPYPQIPDIISGDTYSFTVPMIYKLVR